MATYAIMLSSDFKLIVAMKATSDPTVDGNWASVGEVSVNNPIKSMWTFEDGSDIHVATQEDSGDVRYHVFDPGTDTWTTKSEFVVTNNPNDPAVHACSIALRSDGDVIILYGGIDGADDAIYYARREGTTWTTDQQVDGAASTNDYISAVIVLGVSDRVHFFYKNDNLLDILHRSLSSSNVLDTADQTVDDSTGGSNFRLSRGVSYISGATKVRIAYKDSGNDVAIGELDSGADPTIATSTGVSDSAVLSINGQAIFCLANDGTTLHLLYSQDTDKDIFHDENADDAGWGTDDEEKDAVTANRISCNVYTRGSLVLAYLYLDGTTSKYAERSLAVVGDITPPVGSAILAGIGPIMDFGIIVPTEI